MAFDPVNDLEKALMNAARDPAWRPRFYEILVKSDIFLIQDGPLPQVAGGVLQEAANLRLRTVTFNDKPYVPFFSSVLRLQAFVTEEVSYVGLNALTFFQVVENTGLLLNPGSDYGKEFTFEEIESIIDGSLWQSPEAHKVPSGTPYIISDPAEPPTRLMEGLSRLFRTLKEVKRAYIVQYYNHSSGEPAHPLVAVEVTGDWERITAAVNMVMPSLVKDHTVPIDFCRLSGGNDAMEQSICQGRKPFYEKAI